MMASPEYDTLMQCYPKFVACVEQSPGDVADKLIPIGIFAPGDESFLNNSKNDKDEKAKRIIDVTKKQVQINPQVFHEVVSALEASGRWTKAIVSELNKTYLSLSGAKEQASPKPAEDKTPAVDPSNQSTTKHAGLDITEKTLKQETTRMRRKFKSLVRNVVSSIKASGATAKDLAMFLQQIQSVNAGILATRQPCLLFTHELLHKIETECGDIDAVFEILKSYYSWFNFELIKCIMEKFCHKDVRVKEKLSDYETHMNRYFENKLCQFPDSSNGFGEHRDDTRPYVFKVDEQWTEMRFGELDEIIMTICDVLKLRKAVLFLQAVGGSNDFVELTFDLPEHVIDIVFPLSEDQVEALKEQGVQYCGSDKSLPDSADYSVKPSTSEDTSSKDSSIKQKYLRFVCGCGKCTVLDYISSPDYKCQNQRQLPFPELSFSEILSDEVIIDIEIFEQTLLEQSREIHELFVGLLSDTSQSLIQRQVNLEDVKHYLEMLFTPSWYFLSKIAPSQVVQLVEKPIHNFRDLTSYLQKNYCSWFNYKLVRHLRKRFLYKFTEDEPMSQYEELFKQLVHRRCFLFMDDMGPNPSKQIEVAFKVDVEFTQMSHELIEHLRYVFNTIIGISKFHLTFKKAKEGCTELIFRAPKYVQELTKLSVYQVQKLKTHNFIQVRIGTNVQFNLSQSRTSNSSELGNVSEVSDDMSSLDADGYLHDSLSSIKTDSGSVQEADVDTTDNVLTYTETEQEVSYSEIIGVICKKNLKLEGEMELKVPPCTFWKVSHDGHPHMALVYNGPLGDKLQFSEFANDMLNERQNVLNASCIHLDNQLSDHPILLFKPEQSLRDYCISREALSEVEQLSVLHDVAVGTLGFPSTARIKVTLEAIFIQKDSNGEIGAFFSPLYKHSYFPQMEQTPEPSVDYEWVKDALLLMHYRDQYNKHSDQELPQSHILYNIMKYKWFSGDENLHPKDVVEIAKEICYILDLEKTRTGLMVALSGSDLLEVSHLHMLLLGHTGVGKTSIRKHLQNIPFDEKEKSTIIMEQELCQVTIEASTDSSSSVVFQTSENVYKSDPDKVFLTLWDTGGQPMFQDLLPCFAKLRSIYGIVFRICDLMGDRNAVIRPVSSLEHEIESPYTYTDYINRCLAFIEFFSSGMHHGFSNLPLELRNVFVESTETFPKVALIGTFKDTVQKDESGERYEQLRETIQSFQLNFPGRVFCPSDNNSMVFEIDNTRSGQRHEDHRMIDLRKQIVACTQSATVKIPSKWVSLKVDLEHEAQIQQPCTGIVTFEKANELAEKHDIDPKPALYYFHELGIFLWYRENELLEKYIIIEPKILVSILGTVLNPKRLDKSPELWEELQMKGIINRQTAKQLFKSSNTGLPLKWILSFFEEHHLAMPLNEGYFIPSMLQVLKICPNHLHICARADSVCTSLHHQPNVEAVPLFLVPKSKCIPPGFFSRLMTVLAGIQEGEIIWKVSHDTVTCKNIVSFAVNDQICIMFTEFINCVRVHLISLPGGKISPELCQGILSQLKIQLQRVFPNADENLVSVTFACFCSKPPHFLLSWPASTEDNVQCKKEPNVTFNLTKGHKIWLKMPLPKIDSNEDAKKLFDTALKEGSVNLQVLTVVFKGSKRFSFKQKIFEEPMITTSTFYISDGLKVLSFEPEYLEEFFASNATLPQEANSESEVEPVTSPAQGSSSKAGDLDNSATQKDLSKHPSNKVSGSESETNTTDHKAQESDKSITQLPKVPTPASSSTTHSILNVVERTDNILKRMQQASKEQQSLKLLHAIECSELDVMRILPLILQHAPDYGIGHAEMDSLKTIVHISQKWLAVQTEEMVIKSVTSIISRSYNLPFAIDISETSRILSTDLALLSQNAKEKAIPYGWFYLCYCIQNAFRENKRNIFSMKEISNIAEKCDIPIKNLSKVLSGLGELGLLLYYESVLPNVVFKDATLIITILEYVICNNKIKSNPGGIISKKIFSTIEDVFVEDLFTYQDAIKLLQHLSIISPINSKLLLMPTLLENVFDEKHLRGKGNNSPLLIEYPVAPGVFEYLVCYLTSKQNENSWPWKINTRNREPTCLYKNCVELILPGYDCIITLFQSTTSVKVYVKHSEPPFSKIKRSIVAGLKSAYSSYHYPNTLVIKLGFNCLCGSGDSPHIMVYDKQGNHLLCSYNLASGKTFSLSNTQKVWFEEGIAEDDDVLSVHNVFKFFLPRCEEWYQVGLKLGLTTRVLQNISREKPDVALMEAVKYWFKNTPNPSWDLIERAFQQAFFLITSRKEKNMVLPMGITVQSVVIAADVYVGGGGTKFDNQKYENVFDEHNFVVMRYRHSQKEWIKLEKYTQQFFAMISHNKKLILVGGCDEFLKATGQIAVYDPEGRPQKWSVDEKLYPPLQTPRYAATAVCYECNADSTPNTHIVVIGGCDKGERFSSVEVLKVGEDRTPSQWYCAEESLPIPRSSLKSALADNILYLMGGKDHDLNINKHHPTKVVYRVNISDLICNCIESQPTRALWQPIKDIPLEHSTPVCVGIPKTKKLLAIGGRDNVDSRKPSEWIYLYRDHDNRWDKVGKLSIARFFSACSVLSERESMAEVIVAGGESGYGNISDVEILSIKTAGLSSYIITH